MHQDVSAPLTHKVALYREACAITGVPLRDAWLAKRPRPDRAALVREYREKQRRREEGRKRYHRYIPAPVRREVVATGQCAYCRRPVPPDLLTVDHILPVALGGTRHRSNLAAACEECNADKSDRTPAEWFADVLRARLSLLP